MQIGQSNFTSHVDGLKRWLELFCLKSFSFKDSWAGFAILFLEGFGRNHIIIKEKKGSRTRGGEAKRKEKNNRAAAASFEENREQRE